MPEESGILRRIVITGVPGTGKTTLARGLAKLLGTTYVSLNEFAISHKLFSKERGSPEKVVDPLVLGPPLRRHLSALAKGGGYVAEGHLACELSLPADRVLVLRADPNLLLARYKRRGYPRSKSRENVLAELLDYCLVEAERRYPPSLVVQIDCTKPVSAKAALSKARKRVRGRVSWSRMLLSEAFRQKALK